MQPPKSIWHSVKKCNDWIEAHMPGKDKKSSGGGFIDIEEWERE
jgi:hypothetical protein